MQHKNLHRNTGSTTTRSGFYFFTMASHVYLTDDTEENSDKLFIHLNRENRLFVCLEPIEDQSLTRYVTLGLEDCEIMINILNHAISVMKEAKNG